MGENLQQNAPPQGQGVVPQVQNVVANNPGVPGFAVAFNHPIPPQVQLPPPQFTPDGVRQALGLQPANRANLVRNPNLPVPLTERIRNGTQCQLQTGEQGKVLGFDGGGKIVVEMNVRQQGQVAVPLGKIVWRGAVQRGGQDEQNLRNNPDTMPAVNPAALQPGDEVRYCMQGSGYQTVAAKGIFRGLDADGNALIDYDRKERRSVDPGDLAADPQNGPPANVYDNLAPNQVLELPQWLNAALQAATNARVCNNHQANTYIDGLQNAGYQCFVVGGAVRDVVRVLMRPEAYQELKQGNNKFAQYDSFQAALQADPNLIREVMKDIDVVTTAPMSEIKRLSPEQDQNNVRTRGDTQQKYGIVTYKGDHDAEGIDIATMRSFGMFTKNDCAFDHDITTDTFSRDFGCNMLMYDPQKGVIVDCMARDNASSALADAANQSLSLANDTYVYKNDMLALRAMKFQPRGYEYAQASQQSMEDNFRAFYEFPDDPDLQERRLNKLGSNVARICKIGVDESVEALEAWVRDKLHPAMVALNLGDYYDAHIDPDQHGNKFINRIALGRIARYPGHWDDVEIKGTKAEFLCQAAGLAMDKLSVAAGGPFVDQAVARVGSSSAGAFTALAPYLSRMFDSVSADWIDTGTFDKARKVLDKLGDGLRDKSFVAQDPAAGGRLRNKLNQLTGLQSADNLDPDLIADILDALGEALGVVNGLRAAQTQPRKDLEDLRSQLTKAADAIQADIKQALKNYQPASGNPVVSQKRGIDGFFAEMREGVIADKSAAANVALTPAAQNWLIQNGMDDPQAFGSLFYFMSFHGQALQQPFDVPAVSAARYGSAIQQGALDAGVAAKLTLQPNSVTFALGGQHQPYVFQVPQGAFAAQAVTNAVEDLKNAG